jgi:hypothetical protein
MTTETDNGPEVILHIGTMKSGTSYLQAILRRNKRVLNRDGVQIPRNMVPAVVDVLGRRGATKEAEIEGAWERFLHLVEAWDGRSVLASQEFLSGATESEAQSVVATLPEGKVRVIITNRDLLRVIPSHWQTVVKNGGTWPFPEYVRLVLEAAGNDGSEHRYSRGFWRHHDVGTIVSNWAGAVGIDNVVLVTVPSSSAPSDLLWQRFAQAIGVNSDNYDHEANAKSNISLSYAETEMLREVNMRVRKPLGPLEYRLLVNKYLANKLLRKAPETGKEPDRPTLGEASHKLVAQRADDIIEAVAASGVRVIGDLEELRVSAYRGEPGAVDSTGPRDRIPDSVPQALARLVLRIARLERDLEHSRKMANPSAAPSAESPRGPGRGPGGGAGGGSGGGGRGGRGARGGGGGGGGKGGGKKGAGGRQAAKRAAKKAAAQGDMDDEFDSFEATAYAGREQDGDEPGDDDLD